METPPAACGAGEAPCAAREAPCAARVWRCLTSPPVRIFIARHVTAGAVPPACRYWDGPSPQAAEHDEEVGSWTYYGNGQYDYPSPRNVGPRKR